MEKAKRAREEQTDIPLVHTNDPSTAAVGLAEPAVDVREELRPQYRQTQVFSCEPDVLKKHKIVGLFHEGETSDQLKILRTQVLNRMAEIKGNSLLVTSARPLEGKTTTAINLAVSLSHKLDHTVLLVDADLRKPSVHRFFNYNVKVGLSDYLLGQAEIPELMLNPGIEKLVILPGGSPMPNSTELMGSPRMERLVKEMKSRYADRFIIFDSSSLLNSADPLIFSRFVDGILLVVEAEKTPYQDIQKAVGMLKERLIIGTILNKVLGQ